MDGQRPTDEDADEVNANGEDIVIGRRESVNGGYNPEYREKQTTAQDEKAHPPSLTVVQRRLPSTPGCIRR